MITEQRGQRYDVDLRRLTVATLMHGLSQGEPWAWQLLRQVVASSALITRSRFRRGVTPLPGPLKGDP